MNKMTFNRRISALQVTQKMVLMCVMHLIAIAIWQNSAVAAFKSSYTNVVGSNKYTKLANNQQEMELDYREMRVCVGTNGRMSVPANRDYHYKNLHDRYINCTYVDGNLELTWIQNDTYDLSFLHQIREVTGYVLISHVDTKDVILPKLQIIRGRTLFKVNVMEEEFALFVTLSQMHTLQLPALRDILSGSAGIFNNYNLCHIKTIDWYEILTGPGAQIKYSYNFTSPERECPSCDKSCHGGCWGEGPHNCQKFSKVNCPAQCAQGRCFGPNPRDCCHLFCAGGCTGPTQRDCLACRNFYDDGVCKQECPPMQRYNPTNYLWEPNPDGKYAYGATCVRDCPKHLLKDQGACVRTCPPNKMAKDGECMPCNGACPKTCPGEKIVHSGNIDKYINCTVIEGSLEILDQTFNGYQHVYANFSFGERYTKLHPDRLEVFSTLKEITGYLNIQGHDENFKNLSYFRNLEVIGGRELKENLFASLYIVKTSLRSLNLKSLKKVNSGSIVIVENQNLCYAEDIDWNVIKKSKDHDSVIQSNRNTTECALAGQSCDKECSKAGCWGAGPSQCLECKHFTHKDMCLSSCDPRARLYQIDAKTCGECHEECRDSCTGPHNDDCSACKNVKDGKFCVKQCPESKYAASGKCEPCHETCVGCRGPRNTIAPDGCITCDSAIINNETKVERCLKKNDTCPDGYYYDWIGPQADGAFKPLTNKQVCRKCHPLCKRCKGYGFHESVCLECAGYKIGELCGNECPSDYYADKKNRVCNPCDDECRGCHGVGPEKCDECRNLKIFLGDPNDNTTAFHCTERCPETHPHKIHGNNGFHCAAEPISYSMLDDSTSTAQVWIIIVFIALGIAITFFLFAIYYTKKKIRAKQEAVKMTMVLAGCEDSEPLRPTNVGPNLTKLRMIKEAEIRRGAILGMGAFGRVFKGVWVPEGENVKIPVAIKVLMDINSAESSREFLDEAYIMASVEHPNLLKLLAVCMTNQMMLITQLMPLGCLLDYVRNNKDKIGSKALLNWSTQIARGMEYLENRRLVHRDLAARNVLVQTPSCVKITDFGLAKLLDYGSDEYHAAGGKMPIKWLALECIRHRIFTSKSDVWAFGVTIWELLTYGARPYDNIPANKVPELIENGQKLPQPDICSLDIYCILLLCWNLDPEARPTFKQLADQLAEKARDPGRYLVIPGDKFMRLPSYTSKDEKELIRTLAPSLDAGGNLVQAEEYLQPKSRSSVLPDFSSDLSEEILKSLRYSSDPLRNTSDETDNSREVAIGNLRLNLQVDEDDYLMPTTGPNYLGLIGAPANPTSVENPEYMKGTTSDNSSSIETVSTAPTQTIGIPLSPTETEPISDHEYYNDLQRESKHLLHRNETTV
ncbi:epidermal growth factor receptor [Culicoides brevitarsis]|uniref:epidermal growth factor receptor n=1 Tax=Culicoides brevitarsis TaxID=469753 RepID=UPI00307B690D